MRTNYYKILRVDNVQGTASVEVFQQHQEIDSYVDELVKQCLEHPGDREYEFKNPDTTCCNRLKNVVLGVNRDAECQSLADRLAQVENNKNDQYANLKNRIPQGLLIIALVDTEEGEAPRERIIMAKADYTEFIEKTSGVKTSGLATKKKVFKSFIATYQIADGNVSFPLLMTFDPQKPKAAYWWDDFLDLKQPRTNADNTKAAFKAIKHDILKKIREKHKEAYLPLYRSTMAYMQTEGDFDLEHYRDEVFGGQLINDPTFDMAAWQQKITNLPNGKNKFDRSFPKVVEEITQPEVGTDIELTPLVALHIKGPFEGMENTIQAIEHQGHRGVFVITDDGYDMVHGLTNEGEQQ